MLYLANTNGARTNLKVPTVPTINSNDDNSSTKYLMVLKLISTYKTNNSTTFVEQHFCC
jgi:hypothetical protein